MTDASQPPTPTRLSATADDFTIGIGFNRKDGRRVQLRVADSTSRDGQRPMLRLQIRVRTGEGHDEADDALEITLTHGMVRVLVARLLRSLALHFGAPWEDRARRDEGDDDGPEELLCEDRPPTPPVAARVRVDAPPRRPGQPPASWVAAKRQRGA